MIKIYRDLAHINLKINLCMLVSGKKERGMGEESSITHVDLYLKGLLKMVRNCMGIILS